MFPINNYRKKIVKLKPKISAFSKKLGKKELIHEQLSESIAHSGAYCPSNYLLNRRDTYCRATILLHCPINTETRAANSQSLETFVIVMIKA